MNERILVVDDDDLVRSGLAVNLERAGFEVSTAENLEETRTRMAGQPAHLVLCDLVLGDENGMDILRHLQSAHPDTAVVIITGHGSVTNALEALKGGASDYIQKPCNPEEVIHRVRMVLDSFNLRRSLQEERQRAEERRKATNEQLSRTERMSALGTLAEGAAKDLRDILRPVESIPDALRRSIDPMHEAQGKLIELGDALHKAAAVIRDLETIGKSSTLKKSSVALNQLIGDFLRGVEGHDLMRVNPKVKIETELGKDLPPVSGSSHHLRQMIGNLALNALEAMGGGGLLRIRTSSARIEQPVGRYGSQKPGEFVIISFEDTAARLSDEDLDRLFEPFYVRTKLGRRTLSGLGMTLVYRVVEDHGGYVDITGDNTVGNSIAVHLPSRGEDDAEVLELRPDYTGGERVLLVDDSEAQRHTAAQILRELGYDVTLAESGQIAVERCREQVAARPGVAPFDLVVIDLVLGDAFDGVETYKTIIELYPGQKAILASGFADITRIVEARKLGINRCFQKPYTLESLGKNVRLALDEG
ncbi:MAG TPA: response regulator [Kiritimatiellia bacterium]|nr:response regulator [Kiritimatiellia bacterium]HMP33054.1 response regulator [Kiritimatiellia bacterium]